MSQNLTPILHARYWTTPDYKTNYFIDFVFFALRQNSLSKVIVNGMSGSSCKFRGFIMLSLKALKIQIEISQNKMTEFIDFEVSANDQNQEEKQNGESEISDSDLVSLISFIGDTEIENDTTFYQQF